MPLFDSARSLGAKIAWGARIILVRLRFIGLMVLVALAVASWDSILVRIGRLTRPATAPDTVGSAAHEYYCPMDPSVIRSEPGNCPICGMPLSKRKKGQKEPLPEGVIARVQLAPNRVQLAGVGLAMVTRRPLEHVVDTVGTIDVDERRVARISARVKGRVEKLHVDFTGTVVKQGEPLASLYSQDLYTASRELQLARQTGGVAFESARQRLSLWGLSDEQIQAMADADRPQVQVAVNSPISGTVLTKHVVAGDYVVEGAQLYTVADLSVLWMVARVYENEAQFVRLGQRVQIQASAFPNRSFEGFVSFLDPRVDTRTRTLGVRVDVPNALSLLRPGMYVRALLATPIGPEGTPQEVTPHVVYRCCSACPEIQQDGPGECPKCGMALTPVERAPAPHPAASYECRCPMHPGEVYRATAPGQCGLCGAALLPSGDEPPVGQPPSSTSPVAGRITLYECPMHPEQTREEPGICAPCGTMELIPREVPADEGRQVLRKAAQARGEAGADTAPIGTSPPPTAASSPPPEPRTRTVYECPMHPEVTQDTPGECVKCGGMKLIPREVPVEDDTDLPLAVPVDAVIDTGTRKIVYRAASEGVYDAIEVRLGPRVGDFYPVISGLRSGDQVVARGAFLVDAEARLSPGAAASYFGASGGPSATGGPGGGK